MLSKRPSLFYFINGLSAVRLILGPIIAVTIFSELKLLSFTLFLFAVFTDLLDGYLARRFNLTSEFGRNLDGIADLSIIVLPIIPLAILGDLPDFFVVIVVTAGVLVSLQTLLNTAKNKRIFIPKRKISGVINSYFIYAAIAFSIVNFVHKTLSIVLSSFILILTIFDYFFYNKEK